MERQKVVCKKIPRKDYLKIRLTRMVKAVISEYDDSSNNSTFLSDINVPTLAKVVWLCTLFMCLGIFCYQTYDRILYYRSNPVAVEVTTKKTRSILFPHVIVCFPEPKQITDLYKKYGMRGCGHVKIHAVLENFQISIEEAWDVVNTSNAVVFAQAISNGSEPLDVVNILMKSGTCASYSRKSFAPLLTDSGRFEIVIEQHNGICARTSYTEFYVHDEGDTFLYQPMMLGPTGRNVDIGLTLKEYQYVNRIGNPCVSKQDYGKCIEDCFGRFVLNNRFECSLPLFKKYLNLSPCGYSAKRIKSWKDVYLFLEGAYSEPCFCTRKCLHRAFNEKLSSSKQHGNNSIITVSYDDAHKTIIEEHLIYDFFNLLSDIGGNSGLFIGLSLLSVLNFPTVVFNCLKKSCRPSPFTLRDPLFRKVVKVHSSLKQFIHRSLKCKSSKKAMSYLSQYCAVVICMLFWSYTVYNRVSYFFEYPTRSLVNIAFNNTLFIPMIVICAKDPNVVSEQKTFAKEKNLTQFCDIPVWNLVNLSGLNVDYLWGKSTGVTLKGSK